MRLSFIELELSRTLSLHIELDSYIMERPTVRLYHPVVKQNQDYDLSYFCD